MPAPQIIVRPALAQTGQDHLILLGNTEQLQLSLLLAKAATKSKHRLYNWVFSFKGHLILAIQVVAQLNLKYFCTDSSAHRYRTI